MRNKRISVGLWLIALLIVGWLFWWKANGAKSDGATSAPQALAKQSQPGANPSPATASRAISGPPASDSVPSFEDQQKKFIAVFNTPITFYGKVIDQYGEPVPQADVRLSANDEPLGGPTSEYVRKTDVNGLFSIDGIVGLTLAVAVSKPGYSMTGVSKSMCQTEDLR